MGSTPVAVPTMRGMGDAFKDFGVGAFGGLIMIILYRLFGGIGFLVAPLIAGSMLKGDRGKILSTVAGVMLFASAAFMGTTGTSNNGDSGVM